MNKEYTNEDLEVDVNWLVGYGIDEVEAREFLINLVNKIKGVKNGR